jgi:hypothetical protein
MNAALEMSTELVASRDADSAWRTDRRPLVLFVTAGETAGAWPALVRQNGAECLVTDFECAFENAQAVRPKLVLMDASGPDATVPLIRHLRAHSRTRSAGVAVEMRERDSSAETVLLSAGANIVRSPDLDASTWEHRVRELLRVPTRRSADCAAWLALRSQGEGRFRGRVMNVGSHGMLIESAQALALGAILNISLSLPGDDSPLHVVGQVVRAETVAPNGLSRYGMKFLLLRDDAHQRIVDFVEE